MVTKKIVFYFMVAAFFLGACHRDEEITFKADTPFVPEEIVRFSIAKDHDISFYEAAPGTIIIDQIRTFEADAEISPEINDIINHGSYVEIYTKLAGSAFNQAVLKKIKAAQVRADDRLAKGIAVNLGQYSLENLNNRAGSTSRTAAACSGGNTYSDWFYNQFVAKTVPAGGWVVAWNINQSNGSIPISTDSNLKMKLWLMNGQKSSTGNDVWSLLAGSSSLIIVKPGLCISRIVPQNVSGTFSFSFPIGSGLNCKTTHYSLALYNAADLPG